MSKPTRPFTVSVPSARMTGLQVLGPIAPFPTFTTLAHCSHAGHALDPSLRSNINYYLELFPILIAVRRWGPRWPDKRVIVETDNTQAMAFIKNGTCRNPIAMFWLREIFWISVQYNFHLRSRLLPGKLNQHADRLSRLQFSDNTNGVLSPS